ncbi:helix-turn-helix transcriptional regulator [Virgibacillus sp. AGTR]|uniref:helix-turn-helix domain-containing protein n=1 Tax=Virgibacillus sp. AGTR TaxID=2812055 RepID=UPI001D169EF7|nr:helix-turn-helix transcriptional regulator [Virgibacillus sp. AGTR]MCC2250367.1 helix-turn-helix transcriptional regulator [Virgibacillus sp. AGTR]
MKKIRIRLDELLKEKGYTQAQLADAIEVRRATIHDIYHNKSKQLPIDVLNKITNELKLKSIDKLIVIEEIEE